MRILCISSRTYPRYLAIKTEGRFKGQYPEQIAHDPSMKRKWDAGELGSGTRLVEIDANSPKELISKLRGMGYDIHYNNDFRFYQIRFSGSPRSAISKQQLIDLARN
jgi:hypothetical protein